MSTSRAYVHDCVLTVPVVVGASWIVGGTGLALSVGLAALLLLANLAVGEKVVSRFVRGTAHGGDPAGVGGLVLKQLSAVPLALVLMMGLGAEAVALGLLPLVAGVAVFAVVSWLQDRDIASIARLASQEQAC